MNTNNKTPQDYKENRAAIPGGVQEPNRDKEPLRASSEMKTENDPAGSAQKKMDKRNRPRPLL